MAIFPSTGTADKPFNREDVIQEIRNEVREKFPDYLVLYDDAGAQWDLLIIRTVSREVKEIIGSFHHEHVSIQQFQQVYAVFLSTKHDLYAESVHIISDANLRKWFTQCVFTDNARAVLRMLGE